MFTPTEVYETEHDGTPVKLELRRLKRREFIKISSAIIANDGGLQPETIVRILEPVWADHVTVIDGGMTPQDIIEEAWYLTLLSKICNQLLTISVPGEATGSRSDAQGSEPDKGPVSAPISSPASQ